MRIRLPFAGVFFLLLLLAGYAGLTSLQAPTEIINDKVLHIITFFLLTTAFYWILDTNRRRTLNLSLLVCTLGLGVGSEFLQGFLPNGRNFDLYNLIANIVGSTAALGLCSVYHKRMLERKRTRKYTAVPGEDGDGIIEDVELGEGPGIAGGGGGAEGQHEEGVMEASGALGDSGAEPQRSRTLEEEVDNWDENAVDPWDEDDAGDMGGAVQSKGKDGEAVNGDSKRAD